MPTLPLLLTETFGLPVQTLGIAMAILSLCSLVGLLALPYLTRCFSVRTLLLTCNALRLLSGLCHVVLALPGLSPLGAALLVYVGRGPAGLSTLAVPPALAPPAAFSAARLMAALRRERCSQRRGAGTEAREGVPAADAGVGGHGRARLGRRRREKSGRGQKGSEHGEFGGRGA